MGELVKLFDSVGNIADVFVKIAKLALYVIKIIIEWIPNLLSILNPKNLLPDIVNGTFASLGVLYNYVKTLFSGKLFLSKVLPKQRHQSKGLFGHNSASKQQQKCVRPTWLRLIIMVLCPPLALFMKVGLTGWFYVLLCTILTVYGYYFPGLIYATMHILC